LEHRLHPWSAFLIVPLFALANAGVDFRGGVLGDAMDESLTWAIVLGLVVGKVLGISGAVWLAVRTGLGRLPSGVSPLHVIGVAGIAGIGFTVSLFIADLAYNDPALTETAKIGIFTGSTIAGRARGRPAGPRGSPLRRRVIRHRFGGRHACAVTAPRQRCCGRPHRPSAARRRPPSPS
jgi:Na+/H+ antiporter NhaA